MTARRHIWIFLFALLLPFAQLAAAAHEVTHAGTALETGSKSGLQGGHCDMCALAAHIEGGAAVNPPHQIQPPELRQSAPIWHGYSPAPLRVVPFDSRAPPHSLQS